MAFSGSGTFNRLYTWVTDRINGVPITDTRMDAEMDGFATGLSTCVTKDGQTTTTARVPFAVGVGVNDGTVSVPSVAFSSNTNTGFFKKSTNTIGVATGGIEAMTISNTAATMEVPLIVGDGAVRKVCTGNLVIYYRQDGDDSHTGLTDTSGGAVLTPQKAADIILNNYDMAGFNATIQRGSDAGSVLTSGITISKSLVGSAGGSALTWDGANTICRVTNGNCLDAGAANGYGGYPGITVQNIRLETVTAGNCINARGGVVLGGTGLVFGSCAGNHIYAGHMGQILLGNYSISGSANYHIYGYSSAFIATEGATTNITTSVTFSVYLALLQGAIALMGGQTFTNKSNVTGQKFNITGSGTNVDTGAAGISYLPGTSAGALAGGASYDAITDLGLISYSPTATPDSGSWTSATVTASYKIVGTHVYVTGQLTTTTVGTASGKITITLPVAVGAGIGYVGSAENIDNAADIRATVSIYSTNITLSGPAGGAVTMANGNRIFFSVWYQKS